MSPRDLDNSGHEDQNNDQSQGAIQGIATDNIIKDRAREGPPQEWVPALALFCRFKNIEEFSPGDGVEPEVHTRKAFGIWKDTAFLWGK